MTLLWIGAGAIILLTAFIATAAATLGAQSSLHDTYYVVAHYHPAISWLIASAVFAAAYWALDVWIGAAYPRILAWAHLTLTALGSALVLAPGLLLPMAFPPRRWAEDNSVTLFRVWNTLSSVGYVFIMLGLATFAAVLVAASIRRRQVT